MVVPAAADIIVLPEDKVNYYVVDHADILKEDEETSLEKKLEEISIQKGMDVILWTERNVDFDNRLAFADKVYEDGGYGQGVDRSGVILLIGFDSEGGHYVISTTGKAIHDLSDYGIQSIYDAIVPYLKQGDFYSVGMTYGQRVAELEEIAETGNPYDKPGYYDEQKPNYPAMAITSILFGALISMIVVLSQKSRHRTIEGQSSAHNYVVGGINLTGSSDTYLYHNVVVTPIPRNTPGQGGHSGGFGSGSGGSTIHISSGGMTHGGGGGGRF